MKELDTLLALARRKAVIDQSGTWSKGAVTYLEAIREELIEVEQEIPQQRTCYLEDELADILWNYLNSLVALEGEAGIDTSSVLRRACAKYQERVESIESGESWQEIKARQKRVLAQELVASSED